MRGSTLMCLSIGTPKIINFPFVPNGKLIIFRCPKIWAHYSLIIMWLNIGPSKNHHFPFGTSGKVVVLGVPILKHFRVSSQYLCVSLDDLFYNDRFDCIVAYLINFHIV